AVERNGTKLNLGSSRRWHPGVAKLREILTSGELGTLRSVLAYGGGPLLHTGSHYFDLLLRLEGDGPVEWVQGSVEPGEWDGTSIHVPRDLPGSGQCRFSSGVMGYYVAGGLPGEYEVICTEGSARVRNNGVDWELHRRGTRPDWEHKKMNLNPFNRVDFPPFERQSSSVNILRDLREAVLTDGQTLGNAYVARAGTELALGMVESHRQGGARVSCPVENRSLYMVSK
ncbi:MAG TPA: hypothetical protein VGW38_16700, partial [Chloroflexota bacterium]|nr:hypothetical protein [Chloroflexota bacterium]